MLLDKVRSQHVLENSQQSEEPESKMPTNKETRISIPIQKNNDSNKYSGSFSSLDIRIGSN
jgi:hypothetical protein